VSTSTLVGPWSIRIAQRRRLLRGSGEVQTGHLQPIKGTPLEVPQPRTVTRMGYRAAASPW
jgi:hypothetical protein